MGLMMFRFIMEVFTVEFYAHEVLAAAEPAAVLTSNGKGMLIWMWRSCEHISTHPRSPVFLHEPKLSEGEELEANNT